MLTTLVKLIAMILIKFWTNVELSSWTVVGSSRYSELYVKAMIV